MTARSTIGTGAEPTRVRFRRLLGERPAEEPDDLGCGCVRHTPLAFLEDAIADVSPAASAIGGLE
jgi:hypothetical protein